MFSSGRATILGREEQLVQVEGLGPAERGAAHAMEPGELRVDGDHRLSRSQDEPAAALLPQDAGDFFRGAPRDGARAREDLEPQAASPRKVMSSIWSAASLSRIVGSQRAAISRSRSCA